jgi:hypothetical protein
MKFNIVCHDKKSFEISGEQEQKINELITSNAKGVKVNGEYISFSNIARIEKSEATDYVNYTAIAEGKVPYSVSRHKKRLNSMRDGFLRGVSDKQNLTEFQKFLFDKMGLALSKLEDCKSPAFMVGRDD